MPAYLPPKYIRSIQSSDGRWKPFCDLCTHTMGPEEVWHHLRQHHKGEWTPELHLDGRQTNRDQGEWPKHLIRQYDSAMNTVSCRYHPAEIKQADVWPHIAEHHAELLPWRQPSVDASGAKQGP